jgi:RimJ/RimL family protein N-acetyltransferase
MTAKSDTSLDHSPANGFCLRSLMPSDRAEIAKLLKDRPLQHLLLAFPPAPGTEDIGRWMERRMESEELICFAIADEEDRFCGFVQISGWHKRGRFGWLGMALMPECRSRGLGRWGLEELIDKARRDFDLRKLLLEVRADNAAAINLYRSMSFRTVGELRDHYFDGVDYHDVVIMERMIGSE